ncbi:MAG TPA: peptidoglycan DD-metalloendopeptidase family protein [Allosphingosinicella sp.]
MARPPVRPFLLACVLTGVLATGLATAQPRATEDAAALILARREAEEATRRSAGLEQQAARATSEAARASAQAEAVAARIQAAEAEITAAEVRIRIIEERRADGRARLAERQAPIVRLTAALQTMARRPPALALVQPGSMDDVVHVRSLLATTLPLIRARTAAIREEIGRGEALRRQAETAVASLVRGQQELRRQRTQLARLEAAQRQRSVGLIETALTESDRALAFGEEARDISARIGDRQYEARVRRALEALPGPVPRPPRPSSSSEAPGEPRLAGYRLPVEGRLLTGTGELSEAGVHARGLIFEVSPRAEAVSPGAGRVAYAGRFRGYGEIVIVDHGGGWTSLITNLAERAVDVGARVGAGDLLGRAGPGRPRIGVELRLGGKPVPIAPMLG